MMLIALCLLNSGCGVVGAAKRITARQAEAPTTAPKPATINCDDDALQLCPPMTTEERSSCAVEFAESQADLGACTVCADRHRRLVECVRKAQSGDSQLQGRHPP